MRINLTPKHTVTVTPVYDSYWRLAAKRMDMFHRRVAGMPGPWTDDPILSAHRFTNAYRASDRVSQYLIREVINAGATHPTEVVFRILLFKLFNSISTWWELTCEATTPTWDGFTVDGYAALLERAKLSYGIIYSAAYIMPSPPFGHARKHENHLALIEHMMKDDFPKKALESESLESLFRLIKSYPSMGDFLAFQMAIDINYSDVTNFSEMDYVVAGPGAKNGIDKAFSDKAGLSYEDLIKAVTERAPLEFERLGLTFRDLWGRPLQLIDCQNLFCETDKYARVAHPEFNLGRSKIKQSFKANPNPLPQRYPAKWGLNPQPLDVPPVERREHSLEDFGL